MREVLVDIDRWRAAGHRVAIARVVEVEGSAPRGPGATMAVSDHGEAAGSVSGGCVEGAVLTEALAVLEEETPRLVHYTISDDDAFAVGLTCGGTIHVFIEPLGCSDGSCFVEELYRVLHQALDASEPIALVTEIAGPRVGATLVVRSVSEPHGSLGAPDLDAAVARDARRELTVGHSGVRHYGPSGEARRVDVAVFVHSFPPPPHMIILGAVDLAGALVRVAKLLGFRVTVCDARSVFATEQRFPMADKVVVEWPDRYLAEVGKTLGPRDAVCVLTHDHKFDVPAIIVALDTEVGYLGVMGSRRTHADREQRLRAAGVGARALKRLMAPIGLNIGARRPEETAISICAEIIAVRAGRPASSLRDTTQPIHSSVEEPGTQV